MRLLVIRHAIAEEREAFARTGAPDELRPLTAEGRRRMRRVARGLRREVPALARLATSPLVRARQTAEIVGAEYGAGRLEEVDALAPEVPPEALHAWVEDARHASAADDVVAVVGHEPDLGAFTTRLLAGRAEPMLALKKGGACLLDLAGEPRLLWLATAGQLRQLGR